MLLHGTQRTELGKRRYGLDEEQLFKREVLLILFDVLLVEIDILETFDILLLILELLEPLNVLLLDPVDALVFDPLDELLLLVFEPPMLLFELLIMLELLEFEPEEPPEKLLVPLFVELLL